LNAAIINSFAANCKLILKKAAKHRVGAGLVPARLSAKREQIVKEI
jgi:hypothetical protein